MLQAPRRILLRASRGSIRRRCRLSATTTSPLRRPLSAVAKNDETTTTNNNLPPLPTGSQPLGAPMPVDEHACSVSLPTWASVVGYEEGNPAVVTAMQCGYPRFVYHPYLLQLMKYVIQQHGTAGKQDCLLLPSIHAARRCQIFLLRALYGDEADERFALKDPALVGQLSVDVVKADIAQTDNTSSPVNIVSLNDDDDDNDTQTTGRTPRAAVHAVIFPATTAAGTQAKAYWQHTGEVVSSRRAQACLADLGVTCTSIVETTAACHDDATDGDPATHLRTSLAAWAGTQPDDVILTPSGMSAVYVALQSARRRHLQQHPVGQGGRAIVYGFPYLDTLKLCSRHELCPGGVEFFGRADARDLSILEDYLERNPDEVSVVMTEVPSNPLLHCPNVAKLRALADRYNFLLVVDDTISNFLNVDLLASGMADATVSSLTKLVSGRGDAMAGSVVCSPSTEGGRWMQKDLSALAEGVHSGLYCPDAMALLRNSRDFPERNAQINQTTEALVDWLAQHDAVNRVYYPKMSHSADLYHQVQHANPAEGSVAGYGGLFSMVLDPHMCERTFYDALDVAKGPSLGTNFTLVCPYTLLAHYHELDFAMSYDVPPNLIRVAVGLEPYEVLREKFDTALKASRLYPKVCMDTVEQRKQGQQTTRKYSTLTHSTCVDCCDGRCSCRTTHSRNGGSLSLRSRTPHRLCGLRLA